MNVLSIDAILDLNKDEVNAEIQKYITSGAVYKGTWNAETNTPTIADGTGTNGDFYICNIAGTWNTQTFVIGDQVRYDGTKKKWERVATGLALVWGAINGNISDQTDLMTLINGKQATLVSGTNIKTVNNTSLLGSGNIEIKAGADTDGKSINKKDGNLQVKNYDTASQGQMPVKDGTNGIVWVNPITTTQLDSKVAEAQSYANQSSSYATQAGNYATQAINAKTAIDNKIWFGTIDDYNALGTYNPSTLYIITDTNVINTVAG